MAIVEYVIPMDCVDIAAYRFFGALGSIFTLFQSLIWFFLCLMGAICYLVGCGAEAEQNSFQHCFYLYYFYEAINKSHIPARMNFVTPNMFNNIMWIHVFLYLIHILISIFTVKEFISWKQPKMIRRMAFMWTTSTLIISVFELLTCVIFVVDVITIKTNDGAQCFVDQRVLKNFTSFYSSDTRARRPAPYLLNLKSNLRKMEKQIKHWKTNLLLLDNLLDENSQKHENNPLSSKKNVNRHVKAVWKEMFNCSIRKKIRRKPYKLPLDEELRNFIINEQLVLDDSDYDLLAAFDNLTSRKWMKPAERSNVTFRKQYNLHETLRADNSANIMENKINNKIARKWLIPPEPTTTTTKRPNLYFIKLCKYCIFFVLSPPIFCVIMSLKTGLVWLINVIIALLVGCYGSNSSIKRKFKLW